MNEVTGGEVKDLFPLHRRVEFELEIVELLLITECREVLVWRAQKSSMNQIQVVENGGGMERPGVLQHE